MGGGGFSLTLGVSPHCVVVLSGCGRVAVWCLSFRRGRDRVVVICWWVRLGKQFGTHQLMMMNDGIVVRHLVATSHSATWHLECVNEVKGRRGGVTYCEWRRQRVSLPSGQWASVSSLGVCVDGGGCGGRVVEC